MDPYEILEIEKDASEEEITNKYKDIIDKCTKNKDEVSKTKMQEIRAAYDLIINNTFYGEIRNLIESDNFLEAETKLNILNNTNSAEWNYLKGFILVQKGWFESGLSYIGKAVQLAPDNIEYLNSLNKLQSRVIEYIKKYSKKNINPNYNNMNACGSNNNSGTC